MRHLAVLPLALALAAPAVAAADTTVNLTGIGTQLQASGFSISTHVDQVRYSDPVVVDIPGYGTAYEIHGTVSGIGWGGTGAVVSRAANAHYRYELPFLARWPTEGNHKTFCAYHHGGGPPVIAMLQVDKLNGVNNNSRHAEDLGSNANDVPALHDNCTYVTVNRHGMRLDGTFTAKYLTSEVAPLSQAEVNTITGSLAAAPGTPGYSNPDIEGGLPVPVSPSTDTATFRDINRALAQVLTVPAKTKFNLRLSVSSSAGSILTSSMVFGRSALGNLSVRTGGNYVLPYQPSSGVIFDGFVMNGFVYNSATERADDVFPISAPVMLVQGRSDERYQQTIAMMAELKRKGVELDGSVWLYEIKGLIHGPADALLAVAPANRNGDRLGAFIGAAIKNLRDFIRDGVPPPVSRIAGRIDETGKLVIDVDGMGPYTEAPVLEQAPLDTRAADPMVVTRPFGTLEAQNWTYVTEDLDYENAAIVPPTIACRIGGYAVRMFGAGFTPFTPWKLQALYGDFRGYRDCVKANIEELVGERLYDKRVESPGETAEKARPLFEDQVYPNGVDARLQAIFDRLCDMAAAGDTVTIRVAAGEYREQLYTMCAKPLNLRILGAGAGVTRFVSDNDFQSRYHGIQSDRQLGALITCARAGSLTRPDGTDACDVQFPPGSPVGFHDICKEWTRVTGPFTPYDSSCEVRDLSIDFDPSLGKSRVGPASQMLSFYWNRPTVSHVTMRGFPALQLTGANVQDLHIDDTEVSCAQDGVTRFGRGIGVLVNALGLTDPTAMIHGTVIQHSRVNDCDVGIGLTRLEGGLVSRNHLEDNNSAIVLTGSTGVDTSRNHD